VPGPASSVVVKKKAEGRAKRNGVALSSGLLDQREIGCSLKIGKK